MLTKGENKMNPKYTIENQFSDRTLTKLAEDLKSMAFPREFLLRHITKTDDCWLWTGLKNSYGYGVVWFRPIPNVQIHKMAHRAVYESFVGEIPDGLQLDHLCRNCLCVNPSHLEPVTGSENSARRGNAITHCKRGHEFTTENLKVYYNKTDGRYQRSCINCKRFTGLRYYYDKKRNKTKYKEYVRDYSKKRWQKVLAMRQLSETKPKS